MSRQGSASYTIAIGAMTAIIIGAIVLTIFLYPIINAFRGSGLWNADTAAGNRLLTYTGGIWEFWGAIILIAILAYVWIRTRQ